MSAILFAPHHDDETLWAAFLCQTHRPLVVTVLQSEIQEAQGVTNEQRKRETAAAVRILRCGWQQWPEGDRAPDWLAIEGMMQSIGSANPEHRIFAPWPNPPHGHEHHDEIGQMALDLFGPERVTWYTTYNFGAGRQTSDDPVPYTGEMLLNKLRAMACYESQILRGPRRFFAMPLDEYTATP